MNTRDLVTICKFPGGFNVEVVRRGQVSEFFVFTDRCRDRKFILDVQVPQGWDCEELWEAEKRMAESIAEAFVEGNVKFKSIEDPDG